MAMTSCSIKQAFYGFRWHLRVSWPGVITRVALAPANCSDKALAPRSAGRRQRLGLGGLQLLGSGSAAGAEGPRGGVAGPT